MGAFLVLLTVTAVIWLYFASNPMGHSNPFMFRRFVNWFPLGMSYAFLYMGRYNLSVAKVALGSAMDKESFGIIFAAGTITYGFSFLLNGPLVDKIGGRKGILISTFGSCLANVAMGLLTYWTLTGQTTVNLTLAFSILYATNMFFQSYGAVSIIKVKAYWFHVRERGLFGAIFGTLISFGVYFALDWGQAIAEASKGSVANPTWLSSLFQTYFGTGNGGVDAIWLVFFIPAAFLIMWFLIDYFTIRDMPSHANFEDFDTHDASSGDEREYTMGQMLYRIFTHPVILMVAFVEFTTGVTRNGIMQWYFIFGKEVPQPGAEFFTQNWGLILCITGIFGGFMAGHISDKYFHSRRGPPVAIFCAIITGLAGIMASLIFSSPVGIAVCSVAIGFLSIAVHSLMSGTAAADFGGRKMTATASGITDGFVYLGTGLQSVSLGFLVTKSWIFWPLFLVPFGLIGCVLAVRMWRELPEATKRYLATVERVTIEKVTITEVSERTT